RLRRSRSARLLRIRDESHGDGSLPDRAARDGADECGVRESVTRSRGSEPERDCVRADVALSEARSDSPENPLVGALPSAVASVNATASSPCYARCQEPALGGFLSQVPTRGSPLRPKPSATPSGGQAGEAFQLAWLPLPLRTGKGVPRGAPDRALTEAPVDSALRPHFRFEDTEVDTAHRELRRGSERVSVAPKPFDLLLLLLANRHRSVSRAEVLERVWHGVHVSDATVASTLRDLRRALGDEGKQSRLIRTLRGVGLRFIAPVEELRLAPDREASAEHFVGREALLSSLREALEAAARGLGGVAVIAGAP